MVGLVSSKELENFGTLQTTENITPIFEFLRKLAVVDAISLSRFSNQSLAVELLIAFPIRLQIVSAGRRKRFPAGSSPLQ